MKQMKRNLLTTTQKLKLDLIGKRFYAPDGKAYEVMPYQPPTSPANDAPFHAQHPYIKGEGGNNDKLQPHT